MTKRRSSEEARSTTLGPPGTDADRRRVRRSPASAQSEAPIAAPAPEPPPAPSETARLQTGDTVTLRVRQVIPCDGLTAGERLLSGLPAIAPGDRVLAENVRPGVQPPALIGGTIVQIVPPRRFAKPGRVTLELRQFVQLSAGPL